MELRHLVYFQKVAEVLHFSKAAAMLHISQPPLSRQIKELEQELGVVLFNRSNKRVSLTEAGKYFLRESEQMLSRLERSKQIVRQVHEAVSGEFRIGYISATPKTELARALHWLRRQFPFLKTRLYEVSTIKQINALEEGRLDVGIMRAPVRSEKLHVETLAKEGFTLVSPQTDPVNAVRQAMEGRPFVSYNSSYAPDYHQQLIACCNRLGFSPEVYHECNNMYSILSLVESGLGIAIVPVSVKVQYPFLKLAFDDLTAMPVFTEVVIAHHLDTRHPALHSFKLSLSGKIHEQV